MKTEDKNNDVEVDRILEDGILVIVSGRKYFVRFEEYKILQEADSGELFKVECVNGKVSWPSLAFEVSLDDIEIPVPELVFTYPKAYVNVIGASIILGTVLVVLSGTAAIFGDNIDQEQIFYAKIAFVVFTICSVYLLFIFTILRQRIKVDNYGIYQITSDGNYVSIGWNDIERIKDHVMENYIKIYSKDNVSIRINYQLGGFADVINIVLSKTGIEIN